MSADLYGLDMFGESAAPKPSGPVAERFIFPPFTILDAKSGDWQERKRAWLAMGIKSEIGRGGLGDTSATAMAYFNNGSTIGGDAGSVFDPVVCELAYRWFSPEGGQVVDPFAGGSVRGVVAKSLGRRYWGCDLRREQIEANILQAEQLFDGYEGHSGDIFGVPDLKWVCGDSTFEVENAPEADFVFSCPPYGDLEVYSDDPSDLSAMGWEDFLRAYRVIIGEAVKRLKPNRFACFVVGDFRCEKGFYRNFVSETIAAFEASGARLYNEAILATSVGSACMRVTKQFNAHRKMAKTHQNVLVFCKGDPKIAAAACKAVAE